jgi:hypothetical protein
MESESQYNKGDFISHQKLINTGGYDIDVDISKLSLKAGQYFIRILSASQNTQVIKLIVQ